MQEMFFLSLFASQKRLRGSNIMMAEHLICEFRNKATNSTKHSYIIFYTRNHYKRFKREILWLKEDFASYSVPSAVGYIFDSVANDLFFVIWLTVFFSLCLGCQCTLPETTVQINCLIFHWLDRLPLRCYCRFYVLLPGNRNFWGRKFFWVCRQVAVSVSQTT